MQRSRKEFFIDVFSGTGLGLLVGLIVGLSLTPVVSTVIGALCSILAAFLGLQGSSDESKPSAARIQLNGIRIGSFGIAAVLGLLLALYIRASEPFAPSMEEAVEYWTKAGVKESEIGDILLFERLGIEPRNRTINIEMASLKQKQKSHALFAELSGLRLCEELDPAPLGDDPGKVIKQYLSLKNNTLTQIAKNVEELPTEHQIKVLKTIHVFVCDLEKSGETG
jgi:hypothetical protein